MHFRSDCNQESHSFLKLSVWNYIPFSLVFENDKEFDTDIYKRILRSSSQ
jgi:hypothetical protein